MNLQERLKAKKVWFNVSGKHLVMTCIDCSRVGKMYFNYIKNIGDCKVCGKVFTIREIFDHYKLGRLQDSITSFDEFEKYCEEMLNPQELWQEDFEEEIEVEPEPLPEMVMYGHPKFPKDVARFLADKRINTVDHYELCGVVVDPSHKYFSRLVIPVYNYWTREYRGYQARKTQAADTGPKYIFSTGFQKAKNLYVGRSEYSQNKYIPIVENAFVSAGYEGVATFGKSLSDDQVDMMVKMQSAEPDIKFTLIWDDDAAIAQHKQSAIEKAIKKFEWCLRIKILYITGQPDDYSFKKLLNIQKSLWDSPYNSSTLI